MGLTINPTGAITTGVLMTITDANLRDLVANAPAEMGLAQFAFGLNFNHSGGRITTVDLTMNLTIDMPEWPNASGRPAAERTEWARFLRALRAHEDGHIEIFRGQAERAYNRVRRATPATINQVLESERVRIQGLSDAYDTRTGHGTTQQTAHGSTTITVPP
jgi:hypothetical protein